MIVIILQLIINLVFIVWLTLLEKEIRFLQRGVGALTCHYVFNNKDLKKKFDKWKKENYEK